MTVFRWPRAGRLCAALPVLALCLFSAQAQRGPGNQQFNRYPFDKWATDNTKPQIRWTVRIDTPHLSLHQRLVTQIHASVDGVELQKRQENGEILVFTRIEDASGHRYQTGNETPISRLHQGVKFLELNYTVSAFFLPGDYVISMAVCDGRTLEHSFVRRTLHVAEIGGDPLPGAWKGLPPVEFVPAMGTPDAWFLPQMHSQIRLPVETKRPVRVEVMVNTTPTDQGSVSMFRENMELVVPSLRVLSGIDPTDGSVGLSVVDLDRRAPSYEQPDLGTVVWTWGDWLKLRPALSEAHTATIDAKTLAGQSKMLDYFSREAAHRVGLDAKGSAGSSPDQAHVLIVLSAPVFFTRQDRAPLPDLPPDPDHRIFYIRYAPAVSAQSEGSVYMFTDDLEHILKPMGARVFRVSKPEEFRKAVGTILDEIARLQVSR